MPAAAAIEREPRHDERVDLDDARRCCANPLSARATRTAPTTSCSGTTSWSSSSRCDRRSADSDPTAGRAHVLVDQPRLDLAALRGVERHRPALRVIDKRSFTRSAIRMLAISRSWDGECIAARQHDSPRDAGLAAGTSEEDTCASKVSRRQHIGTTPPDQGRKPSKLMPVLVLLHDEVRERHPRALRDRPRTSAPSPRFDGSPSTRTT